MAGYHTIYTCLVPHHTLRVSQDLYKLTSKLKLVDKPLSLEPKSFYTTFRTIMGLPAFKTAKRLEMNGGGTL